MKNSLPVFLAGLLALISLPAVADQQTFTFGGDTYAAGQSIAIASPVLRDAFEAGNTVVLSAAVGHDAHLAGFDVQSNSDVGGNLYAAGFSVSVGGTIKGDITAMGNTVSVHTTQPVSGNVRAAAANFTLDSGADGSVLVTAETATINAKGDAMAAENERLALPSPRSTPAPLAGSFDPMFIPLAPGLGRAFCIASFKSRHEEKPPVFALDSSRSMGFANPPLDQ